MKIDFVRHGKTNHNEKGIATGWDDPELNLDGISQAKDTAKLISNNYDELYSSDLLRCKQTAQILNEKLGLKIKYDQRLRERNFGSLAGKNFSSMDSSLVLKEKDKNQEYDYRPYGGESVEDVKERIFSFIRDILVTSNNKNVLVVTSGGVVRLLHKILNNEIHEVIHNSSIHSFDFPDSF